MATKVGISSSAQLSSRSRREIESDQDTIINFAENDVHSYKIFDNGKVINYLVYAFTQDNLFTKYY
ncbi:MAG: hypothetical protein ACJAYV_001205 [Oleispira sp.]|jgi:hypothetical protein